MAIAIRNGQRFRIEFSYVGGDFHVTRYEREHDPASYFYVIHDNVNNMRMECDEEDAVALERELQKGSRGELPEAEFEAKLKQLFEETLRDQPAAKKL